VATTTITALTAGTALAGTEVAPFDQGASTVKITATQIKTWTSASPTLVTPTLGVATATSINKVALTAPATGSTLTIADGKTLTASNTLTLAGTDSTTMTFPSTSATIARTDASNTFTGTETINPAKNASAIIVSGGSITGSGTTVPGITVAGTLNTSGAVDGAILFGNVTDTASAAGTNLVSLQVGGITKALVSKRGAFLTTGNSSVSDVAFGLTSSGNTAGVGMYFGSYSEIRFAVGSGVAGLSLDASHVNINSTALVSFGTVGSSYGDIGFCRNAAGVLEINSATAGTYRDLKYRNIVGQTGYTEMVEMTAPAAGAANTARIYAVDNGAGKTQLMVIFASGAAQQIAIEP